MFVKSIFMEIRSRLRSCSVFITTNVDFKETNLHINVKSDRLVLSLDKNNLTDYSSFDSISDTEDDCTVIVPLDSYCKVIPNSISGLKVEKNNISFRILTEPTEGNFYKELVVNKASNDIVVKKPKVNIKTDLDTKVLCANCKNEVTCIKFERILELPTENLDISEWFCPCHHAGHSHEPKVEIKSKKNDFLYRLTYYVVNQSDLTEKGVRFNAKRCVYHCNRCLAWLGIKFKEGVKFFNSTTVLKQELNENYVFQHVSSNDRIIDDFVYTIEVLMKEFNLGLQYSVMCKIVLECPFGEIKKHILVWVIDKELQVLTKDKLINGSFTLKSSVLAKVLYKIEEGLTVDVETWLSDPSVVSTEISKPMFSAGVEHLRKMSLNVPESCRNANGYLVGYLKV